MDLINKTETACSDTLDLRNAIALPFRLVYLPIDWIVYYVVWPCLMAFGTLSNISFIWTVIRTPTLHTFTYLYLVSLACADEINILSLSCLFVIDYATSPISNGNYIFTTIIALLSTFAFMSSMGLERYRVSAKKGDKNGRGHNFKIGTATSITFAFSESAFSWL